MPKLLAAALIALALVLTTAGPATAQLLPPADLTITVATNSPDSGGAWTTWGTGSFCAIYQNHAFHSWHSGRTPIDYGISDHNSLNQVWKELEWVRTNRPTRNGHMVFAYLIFNGLGGTSAQNSAVFRVNPGTSFRADLVQDLTVHDSTGFYMREYVGFGTARWPQDFQATKTTVCRDV